MKRQHVHRDVMSGVRTLGCQGKRGQRENMNEEHIRLSPWPALTDLAAWLHRTRVASSRGQTETERKRSSMASKSGDGTREKQGSWGSFGGPFPRQIHGIPGSVGSARYHRRASPASRHPAEGPPIQRLHCRRSTRDKTRIQGFGAEVSTSCGPPITDRGSGVTRRREGGM